MGTKNAKLFVNNWWYIDWRRRDIGILNTELVFDGSC